MSSKQNCTSISKISQENKRFKVAQGKQVKSFMQRAAEDCINKTRWTCPAAAEVCYVQQQRTTLPSVTVPEGSTPGLPLFSRRAS